MSGALQLQQDSLWDRISDDLGAAGYADAATEAAACSGSLWEACQDQTTLAGLRVLEWPAPGRRFGIYAPAHDAERASSSAAAACGPPSCA